MCGLVAYVAHGAPPDADRLDRALDAMPTRGPDGRGTWLAPQRRAGLGHVRLATIDPSGGAQPIASEDGQIRIAVTGEIYDRARLRTELSARGHRFRSGSDSELALHVYEDEGTTGLARLRGELALVLWDESARVMVALRDRFGIKPLLYAEHRGTLWLASTPAALFAAGVPARWDYAQVFQLASMQYPLPHATPFAGVSVVPPGHVLVAHEGRVALHRYWDFEVTRAPDDHDDEVAAERLRALLDDAVRVRLETEGRPAFQLSGGIDSSAVLASAARQTGSSLDAYTVTFDDPAYDELAIARETATHLGARLNVIEANDASLAEALPAAIAASQGFVINAHAGAKWLLSRAIHRAGHVVVLTGEGADEVLAGYAHLRVDLGGDAAALAQSNTASAGIMLAHGDGLPLSGVQARLGFVPSWLRAKASLGARVHALLAPAFVDAHAGRDAYALLVDHVGPGSQLAARDRLAVSMVLWAKTALEGYILRTLGDGLEMAWSVEGRLPFLDGPFVDWAWPLATRHKIRGDVEKHVLRSAVATWLPEAVVARRKHPFLAPPSFARPRGSRCRAVLEDGLRSASFSALPFFDAAAVRRTLDRLDGLPAAERAALDPALMLAFSAHVLSETLRPEIS